MPSLPGLLTLLAMLQAACGVVAVNATSSTFLSQDESRAVLHEDAVTAARDVIQLLGQRGYQMLDRQVDGNATALVFRDSGTPLASGGEVCVRSACSSDVSTVVLSSELVARLTPLADGETSVELVGRPLIDGAQPVVEPSLAGQPWGVIESKVVHGFLTELVALGKVTPTNGTIELPAGSATPLERCRQERSAALLRAGKITDLDARTQAYTSAPTCAPSPFAATVAS